MKDVFTSIPLDKQLSNKIASMGFVCACLVVLMHSPASDGYCLAVYLLKDILSMIAVPVFFIISGFLLARHCREDGWYKREVIKRIRTLLVPLWSLCILWLPIKYGIHHFGVLYCGADDSAGVMRLTWWNVLDIPWGHAVVVGMWYVKALFLMVVLSPFLFRLVRGV